MNDDELKEMRTQPGFQRLLEKLKERYLDQCNTRELGGNFALAAGLAEWWNTPFDKLGGQTPAEFLSANEGKSRVNEVAALIVAEAKKEQIKF